MVLALRVLLALTVAIVSGVAAAIWFAPESTLQAIQQIARSRAGLLRKEVEVAGLRHVYLDGGQGEPLLLLHGFGGEKDSFVLVARYLTPSYRVIIPDIPGFGESDKVSGISYSLDEIVERTHDFVVSLGLHDLSIGGNSMGGLIAAAYAAKYSDEVKTLWVISAGPDAGVPKSDLALRLEERGGSLAPKTIDDFAQLMQYTVAKPPIIPRPLLKVMAARGMANQKLHQRISEELMASPPMEARVAGLLTPTLITWGARDRVAHVAGAEAAHRLLPNSSVTVFPELGHLPMAEAPMEVARDYLSFRAGKR